MTTGLAILTTNDGSSLKRYAENDGWYIMYKDGEPSPVSASPQIQPLYFDASELADDLPGGPFGWLHKRWLRNNLGTVPLRFFQSDGGASVELPVEPLTRGVAKFLNEVEASTVKIDSEGTPHVINAENALRDLNRGFGISYDKSRRIIQYLSNKVEIKSSAQWTQPAFMRLFRNVQDNFDMVIAFMALGLLLGFDVAQSETIQNFMNGTNGNIIRMLPAALFLFVAWRGRN
ncbi:MAG: hypothetical protein ACPHK8_05145 [Thermoplasmatota archaeon]